MAENLAIEGRYAVRAPMQWSPTTAASRRRPSCGGRWSRASTGPQRVNVAAQRRDPDSLLNWFERLIRRRRECPELGFGTLDGARDRRRRRCSRTAATGTARPIVAVHELGGKPVTVDAAGRRRRRARRPVRDARRTRCRRRSTSSPTPRTGSASAATACGYRRERPLTFSSCAPLALGRPRVAVDALRARHPHLRDPPLALGPALLGLARRAAGASAAGSRRSAVPRIIASSRITPALNSIRSPGRTSLLGLAGWPLSFTRPPRIASTASARVFTRRAAHSHLSIRTGACSIRSGRWRPTSAAARRGRPA